MEKKFTSNNRDNDDLIPDIQANDYTNLINRLKEINLTIALLKKQYLDKF